VNKYVDNVYRLDPSNYSGFRLRRVYDGLDVPTPFHMRKNKRKILEMCRKRNPSQYWIAMRMANRLKLKGWG